MDCEERARKIWDFIDDWQNTDSYTDEWNKEILPFIAAELRAVKEEQWREDMKHCGASTRDAYTKGFAAAREVAADIVDPDCPDTSKCLHMHYPNHAGRILALQP